MFTQHTNYSFTYPKNRYSHSVHTHFCLFLLFDFSAFYSKMSAPEDEQIHVDAETQPQEANEESLMIADEEQNETMDTVPDVSSIEPMEEQAAEEANEGGIEEEDPMNTAANESSIR